VEDWGSILGRGQKFFLFATVSRLALGPIEPPIQWVPWALSPGVKSPERETDHLSPSSSEVKNACSCTFISSYVFMGWYLIKYRIFLHAMGLS
jgi:hypothetical protein